MENKNDQGIVISEDVISKMVATAALEIDGIADMVSKPANIKGVFKDKSAKSVHVKFIDNALYIDAYVKMKMGVDIVSVCEEAQKNIKESVQNMTGKAVSKISIHVVDIEINEKNTSI